MEKSNKTKTILYVFIVCLVVIAAIVAMGVISRKRNKNIADKREAETVSQMLGTENTNKMDISKIEGYKEIKSIYKGTDNDGNILGYVAFTSVDGYGGPISVNVATNSLGTEIINLRVGANNETEGLGKKITEEKFYGQFSGVKTPVKLHGENTKYDDKYLGRRMKDGVYRAEQKDPSLEYNYFVEIKVKNGKITDAIWDGIREDGKGKKELSLNGEYVMSETGPLWAEQAKKMEDYLVELQEPSKILLNDKGGTDTVSSVSISVSDFVRLAQECVDEARGVAFTSEEEQDLDSVENTVQAVTGATISSEAVIKAANLTAEIIRNNIF